MNNYITFITNFTQNLNTFYISHKFNSFFGEKTDKIIEWKYIGRIKLPEKFIEKYRLKMEEIFVYDYSENLIIQLFTKIQYKYYDIIIQDYSFFNNFSEDFIVNLINKSHKSREYHIKQIIQIYPFTCYFYKNLDENKESLFYIDSSTFLGNCLNINIQKITENEFKIFIKNISKNITNNKESIYVNEIIKTFLYKNRINKEIKEYILYQINDEYLRHYIYFLINFQYITQQEIEYIKKRFKNDTYIRYKFYGFLD